MARFFIQESLGFHQICEQKGTFKLVKASLFIHNFGENQVILVEENLSALAFILEQHILTLAFAVV